MVGLGKMGLSHLAIVRAHPEVELVAACDTTTYLTDILTKYSNLKCYASFDEMLAKEQLDALLVATPSTLHAGMVGKALERGLHVFCEKPFVLDSNDGQKLVELADQKNLVTQVGYHYRFVGAFKDSSCSGGSLRAGGAAPERNDLALGEESGRWSALRLRLPRHRLGQLCVRGTCVGSWQCAQQGLLERRRGRGLLLPCVRRRSEWPTGSQLERRKLPENVDQDLCLGVQWSDYRR
jgi:hypothetical protein